MYDAIDKEYKARPEVEKNTKVIGEYIEHVRKQNSDLQLRLETLSKGYVLNHQEIETIINTINKFQPLKRNIQMPLMPCKMGRRLFQHQRRSKADDEDFGTD